MSERVELPTVRENPERCETCRFWHPPRLWKNDEAGLCRRYPPVARGTWHPDDELSIYESTFYPLTADVEWCGEWQAKRPTPPAA